LLRTDDLTEICDLGYGRSYTLIVPQLHVHSAYSMRRGATLPELIVARAAKLGYTHLAITDRDGLWAVPRFVKSCRKYNLTPLIGAQIVDPDNPRRRLILITENLEAFRRLSEVVSILHLERDGPADMSAGAPLVAGQDAEGGIITKAGVDDNASIKFDGLSVAGKNSRFDPVEIAGEYAHEGFVVIADMPEIFEELHEKIPPGRLYGEIVWGERSITKKRFFNMIRMCRKLGRPPVATGNIHMADQDEYLAHAILTAVRVGKCLKDKIPTVDPACYLKMPSEFEIPFNDFNVPEALINARELAARCAWKWPERKWLIPPPPDLPQGRRPIDHLKEIVTPRLKKKYAGWTPTLQSRLDMELRVIDEHGFANFFLIVSDVVEESKRRGYRTLGRGSAGDSIVSYGLDISQVDPVRYDLYFERFLNPERSSPPDIDLDFSWTHRDEMVGYVEERYGHDKVASVGTIITLGLKASFRETGKALGYSNREISKWSLYLPTWWDGGPMEQHPVANEIPIREEPLKTILENAEKIMELPIHQSVHVGGLVLSPEPVWRYAPLNRAAKGFVITQYDMRDCEDVGLIKLDLLSQRGLGCYEDTLESIKRNGEKIKIDLDDMDELSKDRPTIELFRKGGTVGCFDAESPMIRGLIRKLGTPSYDMHMAATALIRPGVSASGMMQEFIKRHHDPELIKNAHPRMAEILKDTYGIIVYQEDVLKVLHEVAGVSLGQADLLRRMMSGKSLDSRTAKEDLEREFVVRCEERGINAESREQIWKQIASFVGYSFCKAHAAQFAILAWQSAYLKAHFTAEFFASRVANVGGYFPADYYLRDARRYGISIDLPEVNRSEEKCVGKGKRILLGLEQVGCLHDESIESILLSRNTEGPYESVADFLARTGVGYEQTHALVRVGAFRSLHASRPVLLGELAEAMKAKIHRPAKSTRQPLLFKNVGKKAKSNGDGDVVINVGTVAPSWHRDYSVFEQLQAEVDVLGMIVSMHPLEPLKGAMRKAGMINGVDMVHFENRRARVGGILVSFKPATTKDKGDPMAMISLEDLSGTYDTVVFPEAYQKYAVVLRARADGGLCMEGKVQVEHGTATLVVDRVIPLNDALKIKRSKKQLPGEVKMGIRPTIPVYPIDAEVEDRSGSNDRNKIDSDGRLKRRLIGGETPAINTMAG